MKVKSESEVPQLSPTPSNPMDCSLPGSSIHGIFQARVLEWGAITFSEDLCINDFKICTFSPDIPPSSIHMYFVHRIFSIVQRHTHFRKFKLSIYFPFLILKLIFHCNSHMNDRHHLAIQTQAWKLLFTLLTSSLHTKTFIHSDQFCVPNFLKYICFCHFHCHFVVTIALGFVCISSAACFNISQFCV